MPFHQHPRIFSHQKTILINDVYFLRSNIVDTLVEDFSPAQPNLVQRLSRPLAVPVPESRHYSRSGLLRRLRNRKLHLIKYFDPQNMNIYLFELKLFFIAIPKLAHFCNFKIDMKFLDDKFFFLEIKLLLKVLNAVFTSNIQIK